MTDGPEHTEVEAPLLVEQLRGLGWSVIVGDRRDPAVTERASFRDVLIEGRLSEALARLNPGESRAGRAAVAGRVSVG
jgi:hypothetical protein